MCVHVDVHMCMWMHGLVPMCCGCVHNCIYMWMCMRMCVHDHRCTCVYVHMGGCVHICVDVHEDMCA